MRGKILKLGFALIVSIGVLHFLSSYNFDSSVEKVSIVRENENYLLNVVIDLEAPFYNPSLRLRVTGESKDEPMFEFVTGSSVSELMYPYELAIPVKPTKGAEFLNVEVQSESLLFFNDYKQSNNVKTIQFPRTERN